MTYSGYLAYVRWGRPVGRANTWVNWSIRSGVIQIAGLPITLPPIGVASTVDGVGLFDPEDNLVIQFDRFSVMFPSHNIVVTP